MKKDLDQNWFNWLCQEKGTSPWSEMGKMRKNGNSYTSQRKGLSAGFKLLIDTRRHFGCSWEHLGELLEKQAEMEK